MSTIKDQETQAFIELLYERSGRTNGLYTGLYQEWSKRILRKMRKAELDLDSARRKHPGASWVSRIFSEGESSDGQSNICVDG